MSEINVIIPENIIKEDRYYDEKYYLEKIIYDEEDLVRLAESEKVF